MPQHWTIRDMPRQDGRRAIITGGNSGIGFFTALELARRGAHVVLACRNQAKAEQALARIHKEVPGSAADFAPLDLASLASVRSFAAAELASPECLDLLINNAGVYCPPSRELTADGFELQFGVNLLAHFLLTGLLLPKIQRRSDQISQTGGLVQSEHEQPRIVTVSSVAHRNGQLHFDDLQSERTYSPFRAYRQSKLADLLFSLELARRLRAHNSAVLSTAAHPGLSDTNLFKRESAPAFERATRHLTGRLLHFAFNDSARGALPTLVAATASGVFSGGYVGPAGLLELRGASVAPAKIAPQARDLANASRLWQIAEDLTGLRYLD